MIHSVLREFGLLFKFMKKIISILKLLAVNVT